MKISEMIKELKHVKNTHGEREVVLQTEEMGYESFFIIPEHYDDDGTGKEATICYLRWWPY